MPTARNCCRRASEYNPPAPPPCGNPRSPSPMRNKWSYTSPAANSAGTTRTPPEPTGAAARPVVDVNAATTSRKSARRMIARRSRDDHASSSSHNGCNGVASLISRPSPLASSRNHRTCSDHAARSGAAGHAEKSVGAPGGSAWRVCAVAAAAALPRLRLPAAAPVRQPGVGRRPSNRPLRAARPGNAATLRHRAGHPASSPAGGSAYCNNAAVGANGQPSSGNRAAASSVRTSGTCANGLAAS